jgi:hypothetical protein
MVASVNAEDDDEARLWGRGGHGDGHRVEVPASCRLCHITATALSQDGSAHPRLLSSRKMMYCRENTAPSTKMNDFADLHAEQQQGEFARRKVRAIWLILNAGTVSICCIMIQAGINDGELENSFAGCVLRTERYFPGDRFTFGSLQADQCHPVRQGRSSRSLYTLPERRRTG